MGIEPALAAWEAADSAVELHPRSRPGDSSQYRGNAAAALVGLGRSAIDREVLVLFPGGRHRAEILGHDFRPPCHRSCDRRRGDRRGRRGDRGARARSAASSCRPRSRGNTRPGEKKRSAASGLPARLCSGAADQGQRRAGLSDWLAFGELTPADTPGPRLGPGCMSNAACLKSMTGSSPSASTSCRCRCGSSAACICAGNSVSRFLGLGHGRALSRTVLVGRLLEHPRRDLLELRLGIAWMRCVSRTGRIAGVRGTVSRVARPSRLRVRPS